MTEIRRWSGDELAAGCDDLLDVYADAMDVDPWSARARRPILLGHLQRRGLRAVAAYDQDRLVGVAYGYLGAAGQWWHDQVHRAIGDRAAQQWLVDCFEVCELHVRPTHQGSGIGRGLLTALLSEQTARTAVLSTPDHETRARIFYRAGGWVDLVADLIFPGDPRAFAVLGLRLDNQVVTHPPITDQ